MIFFLTHVPILCPETLGYLSKFVTICSICLKNAYLHNSAKVFAMLKSHLFSILLPVSSVSIATLQLALSGNQKALRWG